MPTRKSIENYTAQHFEDSVPYWSKSQDNLVTHHAAVRRNIDGGSWEGLAYEAMSGRAMKDEATAGIAASAIGASQLVGQSAGTDMMGLRSVVLSAIDNAEEDGFKVGNDLGVRDRQRSSGLAAQARQELAEWHEERIFTAANAMYTHSQAIATALDTNSATLQSTRFADGKPIHSGVQMVDSKECDDPDYTGRFLRKLAGHMAIGGAMGGVAGGVAADGIGAIPGAEIGAAVGGIETFFEYAVESEPPKCEK